ncbi:HlyD family type I secretion periplasmic adaptor subunit [bacterium]|nr:HlyD family type I secretion periplasmic adaptor subunit [bacterium]MBU1435341.1 HlyD family type I secretion periplasmic adaptor subunit [bacterium]MBU1502348.1 HlyD family type I secretion periplasmic adaptor subunit [bacterium]
MAEPRISRMTPEAIEFAPGLLAIQESPPSKLPKTILYLVVGLFFILLGWAIFGKLDIVATAEGRLIPKSYVKIVQPAEGGVINEIFVNEGQSVKVGDVLIRMDGTTALSDVRSVEGEMRLRSLQLRRINAELGSDKLTKKSEDPEDLYKQTEEQYTAHRLAYQDTISQEMQVLEKSEHDLSAAQEILIKFNQTLPMYRKNAESYRKLADEGYISRIEADDKEREKIEKEQDFQAQKSTVAGLHSAVEASHKRLDQLSSNYKSQLENERSDTQSQYKRLIQEWGKNLYKSSLLELKAPQSGIVKDLATHTQGSVVSPGTVLMSLVPHDDPLQVEVMIKNEDVGFVHSGQKVKIKLVAYPFQKYGMIDGEVVHVGADAIQSTQQSFQDSSNMPLQNVTTMTYKALIHLQYQKLETSGKQLKLTPGMQTIAEIHLGKRTVMEYLLSPVQKAWQESGRER